MHNFNEYSGWTTAPSSMRKALQGNERADVAIIGGGFTGLMAAITLSEQDVDVVLLEQQFCGFGASGRNAGHLTPTIGRDIVYCLRRFGKERGLKLAHFAEKAVHFTEEVFEQYAIDCDYLPCGNVIGGVHPKQRAQLAKAAELVNSVGLEMNFLDENAVRERGLPSAIQFALQETAGGLLDPSKYVFALRRIAIEKGIRIFENSAVTEMIEGETVTLKTQGGSVTADKVLMATNAFSAPTLNKMRYSVVPVRVTLFNTKPLSDAELQQIGWQGREGIYTAHEALESYRLTPDNRIAGGSKWVQYGFGSKLLTGNNAQLFDDFQSLVNIRFPELPNLEIESFWGGWIGITLDMLPICGVTGKAQNVFYSLGYNGHGVAQASLMGRNMALEMLGQPQADVELLQRTRIPLPPEPLRWLGVNGLVQAMLFKDGFVDRDLSAQR
ncbi:MAG: FAD-binding oxidoreductase [Pseudomonadota bacterium]